MGCRGVKDSKGWSGATGDPRGTQASKASSRDKPGPPGDKWPGHQWFQCRTWFW